MKYLIPVLCAVLLLGGCAKQSEVDALKAAAEAPKVVVDDDDLELRGYLGYFEGKPFTGVAVKKYPNGQKNWEYTWVDGKLHGLMTEWHDNGEKKRETTYKDGKQISYKKWDEDGNPK